MPLAMDTILMEAFVLGQSIKVPATLFETERLFRHYTAAADADVADFDPIYDQALTNRDSALAVAEQFCWAKLRASIETLVDACLAKDVFDINIGIACATYTSLASGAGLEQALAHIDERIADVHARAEQNAAYRQARKAGRSRIIGGGFGIGGALKGMAEAAALNMVTGAAHGIANTAGALVSKGQIATEISKVLQEERAPLRAALHTALRNLYCVHVELLTTRGACTAQTLPERENRIQQAEVMFGHASGGRLPTEKQIELAARCLQLNPASPDYAGFLAFHILQSNAPAAELRAVMSIAIAAGVDTRQAAAIAYADFASHHATGTDRLRTAETLQAAAAQLGYDNTAHSCAMVAAEFTQASVAAGFAGFRDGHAELSAILTDRRAILPLPEVSIQMALINNHGPAFREMSKSIFLYALDCAEQWLDALASPAFPAVMVGFDRADVTGFLGGSKLEDVRRALLRGGYPGAQARTLARTVLILAPYGYKDADPVIAEVERYITDTATRAAASGDGPGNLISTICQQANLELLAVGDRISSVKLANAREAFPIPADEIVLALLDDTVFGNNKNGVAFTDKGFIYRSSWSGNGLLQPVTWQAFLSAEIRQDKKNLLVGNLVLTLIKTPPERFAGLLKDLQTKLKALSSPHSPCHEGTTHG